MSWTYVRCTLMIAHHSEFCLNLEVTLITEHHWELDSYLMQPNSLRWVSGIHVPFFFPKPRILSSILTLNVFGKPDQPQLAVISMDSMDQVCVGGWSFFCLSSGTNIAVINIFISNDYFLHP